MSELVRITVNISARAAAALDTLTALDGSPKSTIVGRALFAYCYLTDRTRAGSALKLHAPNGDVEAVTFL